MKTFVATEPMTVEQIEAQLRKLIPRLGPRGRKAVLLAIEAIQDLANRLHQAEQRTKGVTVSLDENPTLAETMRQLPNRRLQPSDLRRNDGDCPLGPNHEHKWTLWDGKQCEFCMSTKAEAQARGGEPMNG